MLMNAKPFVEWKEEFISQERGSRVVNYILKDCSGESVLAVVGTERSLRHMVYVVADEFLSVYGSESAARGGFKWRSRREVVDWLTSMLCKQKIQDSPRGGSTHAQESSQLHANGVDDQPIHATLKMNHNTKGFRHPHTDIRWLGASWACSKQLKHYPAFFRNETTISIQSFVFVMAEEENRYVAYIEDMYEDKKGQKKVKVRWFHHSQEVKGTVRIRNAHSKELFFTPYAQVISTECVDGPAIVLTREHYEKYQDQFSSNILPNVHLCFRQFKANKIKPFDLSKLRGYFSQSILSSLDSGIYLKPESLCYALQLDEMKNFDDGDNVMRGTKRSRNYVEPQSFFTVHSGAKILEKQAKNVMLDSLCKNIKHLEFRSWHGWLLRVGVKIEMLCQDSGIRGCWYRCTVLEISQKQMKVQYDDLDDEDEGCGKLEEWIRAFRLAAPDRLGMRCPGRPVVRPQPLCSDISASPDEIGVPVDAWWNDGWWEGVVTGVGSSEDKFQVYLPGENLSINVLKKDLRVSRDWVDGKWVDLKPKQDILSAISALSSPETELPMDQTLSQGTNEDKNCINDPVDDVKRGNPEDSAAGNLKKSDEQCDSKSKLLDINDDVSIPSGKSKDKSEDGADHKEENEESNPKSKDLETSDVHAADSHIIPEQPEPMEATQ